MPIVRTYGCPDCNHLLTVELRADQWEEPPPPCPVCAAHMGQEFQPIAIGGSNRAKATEMALEIASNDYGVADIQAPNEQGSVPTVRYKDATPGIGGSTWGIASEALQQAVNLGRQNRLQYGNGLSVLQNTLKSGDQPDLIELSKRRSMKVW